MPFERVCIAVIPLLVPLIVALVSTTADVIRVISRYLMRLAPGLPIDWTEQRKLLGFNSAG